MGGEITCFGRAVEYDYKEIIEAEGAVTVRLAYVQCRAQLDSARTQATATMLAAP